MTLNIFEPGINTSFSDELNDNFESSSIALLYTGTGFDISVSGALKDSTQEYELSSLAASTLFGADYLDITLNTITSGRAATLTLSRAYLTIQTKEIGGAYSDSMSAKNVSSAGSDSGVSTAVSSASTVRWIHTLTAGEKSAGIQIKIKARVTTDNTASSSASVTNVQTIVKLAY